MTISVNVRPGKERGRQTIVRPATDADAAPWDALVHGAPGGTFFHRFAWRTVFRDIFGFDTRYLVAERDGAMVGLLPLVHQKSLLFGKALIAAPFCVEGGPVGVDGEAVAALDGAATSLMDTLKVPVLEYRSRQASRPGWTVKRDLYATFGRALSEKDEDNLLAIPRKQRAVVRKTLAGGLVSEVDEGVDALFRVYSESVRNLGTPVFPKRYFAALKRSFGLDCDIVVIRDGGTAVSAVMNFYFRDAVLPYYGGGTSAARRNGANDFLYWEVMRRAALKGCRRFDFGRSKAGTGAFAFKKNWGFEPCWLEYEYRLAPGTALPEKNPSNPKYARMIALWKRLPLPLANVLGPFLVRGLG
ncbi:MAG: FemAB family PEP-CTERM system-associated protein [Alphaproteobacteria bacterium]|nr:FemAB family PEP-CTERM system-associated protein [Alphaproteobacteria bacterium]